MQTQVSKLNFTGVNLYVGIDTHKKSWKVAIYDDNIALRSFVQDPDPKLLARYLNKTYPSANYHCAYEAGFCGFWIQKSLEKQGLNCIVVNPADVPTTNKEHVFKTDARDCRKIAISLRSKLLEPIYIPTNKGLGARSIVRCYRDQVKECTRCKNKIKGKLNFFGVSYPEKYQEAKNHWTKGFCNWLANIQLDDDYGTWVLQDYIQKYLHAKDNVARVEKKMKELTQDKKYAQDAELLQSVTGVGLITTMTILTEIEDIGRFKKLDKLCSYFGLVPSSNSSGEKESIGNITHRGNKYLKTAIIEAAWIAIRYDPALTLKFSQLKHKMDANQAIIRIGKKLISRVFYVLRTRNMYQKGVV